MNFKELPAVKKQLMKCVRCGKCRSVCPVFEEIKNETVAPRGHVFMVQMLRDGQVAPSRQVGEHLSNCLLCETCTVNCPSGIDIHELNAAARSYVYDKNKNAAKDLLFDKFWTNPSLIAAGVKCMSFAQKLGLQTLFRNIGLTKLLPGDLSKAEKILTSAPSRSARSRLAPVNAAKKDKKLRIGYFLGCATNVLYPDVALATVKVLVNNGCEVIIPENLKCYGLPHIANGKIGAARELMIHNIKEFQKYDPDYIITDCASCSSALESKNLEFLFAGSPYEESARQLSEKVMDLCVLLIEVLNIKIPEGSRASEKEPSPKITYHDPCHLVNAQGVSKAPRELLQRIPGAEYREMDLAQRCCGGSGTFSLTHYDLSMKILDRKMKSAQKTGADIIATNCPSCIMQLKHGVRLHNLSAQVKHPVEIISDFY
ncbi:MAG: (Fe-S)-binding protein [Syntrophomonadaceae bacterium]|nr:(Fe-S)-binding protein [Syntrophomonadaceae bacterium]